MAIYTTNKPQAWLPEQIGELIIKPTSIESVAIQAIGSARASEQTNTYRVPIVTADPTAQWVAEGGEISDSDLVLGEDVDTFHKLAGLTIISSEMDRDASPQVAEQIGLGLARDIARKIDAAFFGARASNTLQPRGLGDLTAAGEIVAGTALDSMDPFIEAIYKTEQVGATVAAFVANPADALTIAQIKEQTGSNKTLLQVDPTQPSRRLIAGVPLLVSPAVTSGTIWALPAAGRAIIAIRQDADVKRDESVFFTSDRIAIRATLRVTTLFPHPEAVQKITVG